MVVADNLRVQLWVHKPITRAHIEPQRHRDERDHKEAAVVELLGYGVCDVLADHYRGEGYKSDAQQLQKLEPQQAAVEAPNELEYPVVYCPEDGDDREAGEEAKHSGPSI